MQSSSQFKVINQDVKILSEQFLMENAELQERHFKEKEQLMVDQEYTIQWLISLHGGQISYENACQQHSSQHLVAQQQLYQKHMQENSELQKAHQVKREEQHTRHLALMNVTQAINNSVPQQDAQALDQLDRANKRRRSLSAHYTRIFSQAADNTQPDDNHNQAQATVDSAESNDGQLIECRTQ